MQAEFREKTKKESEFYRMSIQSEIDEINIKEQLDMEKKRTEQLTMRALYNKKIDEEIAEEMEKHNAQLMIITNERTQMSQEY